MKFIIYRTSGEPITSKKYPLRKIETNAEYLPENMYYISINSLSEILDLKFYSHDIALEIILTDLDYLYGDYFNLETTKAIEIYDSYRE